MSDWGYAERGELYTDLTLREWCQMLEGEDPDDRAIREAHGFGYRTPDYGDGELCRNGGGETYVEVIACKIRACSATGNGPEV